MPDRRVDPVPLFHGQGHVQGIADRRNDEGGGAESPHGLEPEGQQAAQTRVLQNEQPAVGERAFQHRTGPRAEPLRDRRGVPSPVERAPIVPCGAGRRQNFAVQGHDLPGLPMSGRIGRVGLDQTPGQIATEQIQDARGRRRTAAVRADHQERRLLPAHGVRPPGTAPVRHRRSPLSIPAGLSLRATKRQIAEPRVRSKNRRRRGFLIRRAPGRRRRA